MPDLIAIAERLAERPPVAALDGGRCLRVRDRESSCAACADACPVGAVAMRAAAVEEEAPYGSVDAVKDAGPRIDDEACVRCGACMAACPTNALLALPPLDDEELLARVAAAGATARAQAAAEASEEEPREPEPATAGFACERAAAGLRLERERVVVLPCLAWVDAALLVHLACAGAERVEALLGACASCELAAVEARVRAALDEARRVCDAWGLPVAFNADGEGLLAPPDADAAGDPSRRALLSQVGASLIDTAKAKASHARPEPDVRRWRLLDDLHAAGLPDDGAIVPRALAPRVAIDVDRCSGCAQCALFCPAGALRKIGRAAGGGTLLEFDPARCRDCGVCEGTCRYGALTCEETLTAGELFAFDPLEIVIPKRRVLPERCLRSG
ncbi:4Fe-4S binding protein [Arabiibacter massiliensis]|uniref:4Fe-4S binding protein n=1 Tax=Arabiibacter massiliensis TaxID=1870985 RepID=UPI0009BB071D|nr:4Fe-4S binding protein [Arabiibacter massiliensis]